MSDKSTKLTISKLRDAIARLKDLQSTPMLLRIELAPGESIAFFYYLGIENVGGPFALTDTLLGIAVRECRTVTQGEARCCYSDGTAVVKIWRANGR